MVPPESVEDGKIPTKKVKVDLSNSKMTFWDFAIPNTWNFLRRIR